MPPLRCAVPACARAAALWYLLRSFQLPPNSRGFPVSVVDQLLRGMTLPVIGAPMFIVSNPDLVVAQCASGVIGAFPALNARPAEVLDDWVSRIESALD